MNNESKKIIKIIVLTGLLSAIFFIFTFFVAFPLGMGGYISITDILLFYLAFIYRKYPIIIIAILSYGLSDLTKGFPQYMLPTIISRIVIILFIWLLIPQNSNNLFIFFIICFLSQSFLISIYLFWDYIVLNQGTALSLNNLIANIIQGAIITIIAPLFTYFLKNKNFSNYFIKQWP